MRNSIFRGRSAFREDSESDTAAHQAPCLGYPSGHPNKAAKKEGCNVTRTHASMTPCRGSRYAHRGRSSNTNTPRRGGSTHYHANRTHTPFTPGYRAHTYTHPTETDRTHIARPIYQRHPSNRSYHRNTPSRTRHQPRQHRAPLSNAASPRTPSGMSPRSRRHGPQPYRANTFRPAQEHIPSADLAALIEAHRSVTDQLASNSSQSSVASEKCTEVGVRGFDMAVLARASPRMVESDVSATPPIISRGNTSSDGSTQKRGRNCIPRPIAVVNLSGRFDEAPMLEESQSVEESQIVKGPTQSEVSAPECARLKESTLRELAATVMKVPTPLGRDKSRRHSVPPLFSSYSEKQEERRHSYDELLHPYQSPLHSDYPKCSSMDEIYEAAKAAHLVRFPPTPVDTEQVDREQVDREQVDREQVGTQILKAKKTDKDEIVLDTNAAKSAAAITEMESSPQQVSSKKPIIEETLSERHRHDMILLSQKVPAVQYQGRPREIDSSSYLESDRGEESPFDASRPHAPVIVDRSNIKHARASTCEHIYPQEPCFVPKRAGTCEEVSEEKAAAHGMIAQTQELLPPVTSRRATRETIPDVPEQLLIAALEEERLWAQDNQPSEVEAEPERVIDPATHRVDSSESSESDGKGSRKTETAFHLLTPAQFERDMFAAEVAQLNEERKALMKFREQAFADRATLVNECAKLRDALDRAETSRDRAKAKYKQAKHERKQALAECAAAKLEIQQTRAECEEIMKHCELIKEDAATARIQITQATDQLDDAYAEISDLKQQLAVAQEGGSDGENLRKLQTTEIEMEGVKNDLARAQEEKMEAQTRMTEMEAQIKEAEAEAQRVKDELAAARAEMTEAKSRAAEAQTQMKQSEAEAQKAKNDLTESQKRSTEALAQAAKAKGKTKLANAKAQRAHIELTQSQKASAEELAQATEEKTRAETEAQEAKTKAERAMIEAAQAKAEVEQAKADLAKAQEESAEALAKVTEAQARTEKAQEEAEEAKIALAKASTEKLAAATESEVQVENREVQMQDTEEKPSLADGDNDQYKAELSLCKEELEQCKAERDLLEEEVAEYREQIDTYEQQNNTYQEYLNQSTTECEALRTKCAKLEKDVDTITMMQEETSEKAAKWYYRAQRIVKANDILRKKVHIPVGEVDDFCMEPLSEDDQRKLDDDSNLPDDDQSDDDQSDDDQWGNDRSVADQSGPNHSGDDQIQGGAEKDSVVPETVVLEPVVPESVRAEPPADAILLEQRAAVSAEVCHALSLSSGLTSENTSLNVSAEGVFAAEVIPAGGIEAGEASVKQTGLKETDEIPIEVDESDEEEVTPPSLIDYSNGDDDSGIFAEHACAGFQCTSSPPSEREEGEVTDDEDTTVVVTEKGKEERGDRSENGGSRSNNGVEDEEKGEELAVNEQEKLPEIEPQLESGEVSENDRENADGTEKAADGDSASEEKPDSGRMSPRFPTVDSEEAAEGNGFGVDPEPSSMPRSSWVPAPGTVHKREVRQVDGLFSSSNIDPQYVAWSHSMKDQVAPSSQRRPKCRRKIARRFDLADAPSDEGTTALRPKPEIATPCDTLIGADEMSLTNRPPRQPIDLSSKEDATLPIGPGRVNLAAARLSKVAEKLIRDRERVLRKAVPRSDCMGPSVPPGLLAAQADTEAAAPMPQRLHIPRLVRHPRLEWAPRSEPVSRVAAGDEIADSIDEGTIAKGARDERMIISKVKHDQQKQKALQAIPLKEAVYVGPKEHSSAEYTSNDDFDSNEWSEPASVELPEWSKFSVDRRILEPDYKPKLHKPVHPMAWKHDHPSSESEPELPPNVNGPRPIGTKRFATENYGNPTLAQQLAAQSARQASLPNGQRVPSHGFASPTSQFSNMPMPTFATPSIYSPSNTLNTTSFETESALSMSPASLESTLQLAPPVKLRTNYIDYGVPQFRRRYSESRPEADSSEMSSSPKTQSTETAASLHSASHKKLTAKSNRDEDMAVKVFEDELVIGAEGQAARVVPSQMPKFWEKAKGSPAFSLISSCVDCCVGLFDGWTGTRSFVAKYIFPPMN